MRRKRRSKEGDLGMEREWNVGRHGFIYSFLLSFSQPFKNNNMSKFSNNFIVTALTKINSHVA